MEIVFLHVPLWAPRVLAHPFTHQQVVFGPCTASDPVTVTGREGVNQKRGVGSLHVPAEEILRRQGQGSVRTQTTAMPKPFQTGWLFCF